MTLNKMEGRVGEEMAKVMEKERSEKVGRVQEGRGSWRSVKEIWEDAVATGVQCP